MEHLLDLRARMCFFGRRGYQLHLAGRIRSAMVLTKTYKRYALLSAFGIIASSKCNTVLVEKLHGRINEHCVATGANEDVIIWDTRKGEKVCINQLSVFDVQIWVQVYATLASVVAEYYALMKLYKQTG